jgi:hypothetical protein
MQHLDHDDISIQIDAAPLDVYARRAGRDSHP